MPTRYRPATAHGTQVPPRKRAEVIVFVLLAVLVWPVLTVGFVGGYGFAVWMSQQIYGPPAYGRATHGP
jgi:nitrate reductase NapE